MSTELFSNLNKPFIPLRKLKSIPIFSTSDGNEPPNKHRCAPWSPASWLPALPLSPLLLLLLLLLMNLTSAATITTTTTISNIIITPTTDCNGR
jgi:hypothetical protein